MDQEHRSDPMIQVFPRVTKCTFHKFGASGTIEKLDALCVLAVNTMNEKIYIFLWFWFIILAVMSGLALLYSTAIVLSPSMREIILKKRFKFSTASDVSALIRKIRIGDFLLIHFLGQNMNEMVLKEVLGELSRGLHMNSSSGASSASRPSTLSTLKTSPFDPKIGKHSMDTEI